MVGHDYGNQNVEDDAHGKYKRVGTESCIIEYESKVYGEGSNLRSSVDRHAPRMESTLT